MKACCITGIAIAKGVAGFLGIDNIEVKGATGLPQHQPGGEGRSRGEGPQEVRFVFLHINGTDILSHDRKPEEKKEFLER